MERTENEHLEHAVINQFEADIEDKDYEAISQMLKNLIHLEPARKVLEDFLSDAARENIIEGRTNFRY